MSAGPTGVPPAIAPAPTSVAAFVGPALAGPLNEPIALVGSAGFADFERELGPASAATPLGQAVRLFFANGGAEARVVRVEDDEPRNLLGDSEAATGIHALDPEGFNLLNLAPAGPALPASVLAEAARLCRERRGVLIAEPPAPVTGPQAATDFAAELAIAAGEAAADTALYFPRLSAATGSETLAAGGAVAGMIARTDAAHGVWKAPAGTSYPLADVGAPTVELDPAELDALNARGVNSLRSLAGIGTVVWGARTLAVATEPASEWKYVPVRRIALHIEESLDRGLAWTVFEPFGEPLWEQVALTTGDFLHTLWREGAFQGNRPQDAYFVRCDRTTMTQDDIDHGRLVVLVGFAALRPAEFVVLRIGRVPCPR